MEKKSLIIKIFFLGITIGVMFGIYQHYNTLTGKNAGVALLVLLTGLKFFESKDYRDFYICTFLAYFIAISSFFFMQTISIMIYNLILVVFITNIIIKYNTNEIRLIEFDSIKYPIGFLLQSIPIMLILFFLFPRISGPLWTIPKDAHTGKTGISDKMSPGSISELAKSDEIAFRVNFKEDIPNNSHLYWRGPVFWKTDGKNWTMDSKDKKPILVKDKVTGKNKIEYEITTEATKQRWLFALELVADKPDNTYLTHDYQLKTKQKIINRKKVSLTSYIDHTLKYKNVDDLKKALQLPKNKHPLSKKLGNKLRQRYDKPEKIIAAGLKLFKDEAFTYTLTPPLTKNDMVDEFLFITRQGFCEHYAAAFTVLMRSAGIPTRIVTGYQGGEINSLGNYLIVRQYDAHAWNEVWLENKGWLRIDPTAAISPERISAGLNQIFEESSINNPFGVSYGSSAYKIWKQLSNTVDMINYQWTQWFLTYNVEKQQFLLQKIGLKLPSWKLLMFVIFIPITCVFILIAFYILRRPYTQIDIAQKYYNIFCKKISKFGVKRYPYEGPIDFAKRVAKHQPNINKEVKAFTLLYINVRYQSKKDKLNKLVRMAKCFSPWRHTKTTIIDS